MTEEEELDERYVAAGKRAAAALSVAMQHSNVADALNVVINMTALIAHENALVNLLIEKGVITKLEHKKAITASLEAEVEKVRQELCKLFGHQVYLA